MMDVDTIFWLIGAAFTLQALDWMWPKTSRDGEDASSGRKTALEVSAEQRAEALRKAQLRKAQTDVSTG